MQNQGDRTNPNAFRFVMFVRFKIVKWSAETQPPPCYCWTIATGAVIKAKDTESAQIVGPQGIRVKLKIMRFWISTVFLQGGNRAFFANINSAEPNIFHQKSQIRSSLHASGTNAKFIRFLWHNLNQVPQNSMQDSQCWSLIHPYVRPRSSILAWPIATPNKTNMDLACAIAACFPWYWTFCFVPFHLWFHPSFGNVRVARCIRHDQEFLDPSKMQADGPGRMQWSHAN